MYGNRHRDWEGMPRGEEQYLEDGWTKVGRGKGKPPIYVGNLNRPCMDTTLEHVRVDFNGKLKKWRASTCRAETLQILDRARPDEGWGLDKAVCLATGSFSRDNWECRKRSTWQFVAFYDIFQHLRGEQEGDIKAYAQEPEYTPLDRAFLESLNITALDLVIDEDLDSLGPATEHITPKTFVFEPFMDMGPSMMRGLFGSDGSSGPTLYLGSSFSRWLEYVYVSRSQLASVPKQRHAGEPGENYVDDEPTRQLLLHFVESRRRYALPRFEEDPNVFDGMSIYWPELSDEEAEVGG